MNERFIIELRIDGSSDFINSLFKSIEPDTRNIPRDCRVESWCNDSFYLVIDCRDLSSFRALFTSYFNILSVLIKLYLDLVGCES
ncbi:MAG: hypothetical protein QXM54_02205 [Desulfurococcaceae archaeon]